MRILLLSNRFPPDVAGGAEILAEGATRALRRRGHEVVVLTSQRGERRHEPGVARVLRPAVDSTDSRRGALRGLPRQLLAFHRQTHSARSARALRQAAAQINPDVIYVWNVSGVGLVSILRCLRGLRRPIVFHLHAYWWQYINAPVTEFSTVRARWPKRLLIGPVPALRYTSLIACSEALRNEYISVGCDQQRIEVIDNAIGDEFLAPPTTRRSTGGPLLVYAGRLRAEKGVRVALEAVQLLIEDGHPHARLHIYGGGEPKYELELRRYVNEEGLGGAVSFEGMVEQERLIRAYDEADVVLVPSLWQEPFGLVAAEGMARCAAVVASDVGGLRHLISPGTDGLLVPPGDARALAGAVKSLIDAPDMRSRLGHAARAAVQERHSMDVFAARIEAHLDLALSLPAVESRWRG